ncbi:MAG: tyrosine-type recombinase/integrase [Pirellulales bacterium]
MSRRKSNTPPKYRCHKARGMAVVTIDGRDIYLGKFGSAESHEKYARLIAERAAKPEVPAIRGKPAASQPADITIAELAVGYKAFAETYYRDVDGQPSTELGLVLRAVKVVRELYGRTPAAEFGPLRLKSAREAMIAKGWSRSSINHHIHRVKRWIAWAVENELIPASVHHGLTAVAGLKRGRTDARETEPVTPVPQAWIDATLPHCPPVIADIIRLQLLTAARPSELLKLRGEELDTSGSVWELRPKKHKNAHHGHNRIIYFGPAAQAILLPRLKTDDPAAFVFSPRDAEAERNAAKKAARKTPRWPSHQKRQPADKPKRPPRDRYDVGSYRRAIHRAAKKGGVPHWGPHRLRHNSATAIRKSHGAELARIICGHSGLDATAIYAEADEMAAKAAMEKIG